jgi:hypothetical protein
LLNISVSNRSRYYVWTLDVKDAVIVVPEVQFKDFIAELNVSFPNEVFARTDGDAQWRSRSLIVDFPEHPRLAPRFLGVSNSKGDLDRLSRRIPVYSNRDADGVISSMTSEFEETAFSDVIKKILDALRTSNTHSRQLRRDERAKKCREQMLYTQKFLGVRPTLGTLLSFVIPVC